MAKYRQPKENRKDKQPTNKRQKAVKKEQPAVPKAAQKIDNQLTSSWLTNSKLHIILIFVFSFVLYANTLTHDYTLDDSIVITENSFTKEGFSGIADIFGYDTFMGFFGKEKQLVAGGRYRPLSLATFAVEWQIFGQNPMISHFINILLYGLTGMILYLLVFKLFEPRYDKNSPTAYFIALATAMLFLAHPIHTEAVANIKGRDEIMALLGSLTALFWTLKYIDTKQIKFAIGSAVIFLLALLSKENSITFLAIVPLALYFFTKTKLPKIVMATLPYLGMAIVFLVIRSSVLGSAAAIGEEANELMNNPFVNLNSGERYGTIFYTLGKYIQLLIFPHPLTHDYYPRHIPVMTFGNWQVLLSLAVYVILGIYALIRLPKRDPIAFGIIYFIATLSIVSNLVFSVGTNMSERLVFMPSVGFALIIAVLIAKFLPIDKLIKGQNASLGLIAFGVIALLFAAKTITRNPAWENNYTLFKTDIKTSVNSAKLNNAMGGVTIDEANKLPENDAQRAIMYNDAVNYLSKAVEVHPQYSNAYLLTGNAFFYQKDYKKAAEYYRYIAQNFGNSNGMNNLFEAGKKLVESGQFTDAIPLLEEAKAYSPQNKEIFGNLGAAYGQTNQHQKAIDSFQEVIKLDPNNAKAHLFIGYAYMNLSAAQPSYQTVGQQYIDKAYQLDPTLKK